MATPRFALRAGHGVSDTPLHAGDFLSISCSSYMQARNPGRWMRVLRVPPRNCGSIASELRRAGVLHGAEPDG